MIDEWAAAWGVSSAAVADLRARLGAVGEPPAASSAFGSEAAVQSAVRLRASQLGWRLWRNNVGAVHDTERNVHIRFGLANDSAQLNRRVKSGDLVGIRPRIIQQADVGSLIGQFVSIECKRRDWRWSGDEREQAQLAWATLVTSLGGDARFLNSETSL